MRATGTSLGSRGDARRDREGRSAWITRRRIVAAGGAGAAAAALGGVVAACPGTAGSAAQDAEVLAFLLGVQRIEAGFYAVARRAGALRGELGEYLTTVAGHEHEHVAFLEQALGGRAAATHPLAGGAAAAVRDPRRFVRTAAALEDTVVAACNGQAANVTPGTLAEIAGIVSVEARHAAWVRDIGGLGPAQAPTDAPLTSTGVRAALRRLGLVA